jgi:biopolymer transport protein ExbD
MAEINTGNGKKSPPRVDMTPMVDLGFLLVTFFMVTTTFSKPNVMELGMPDKTKEIKNNIAIKESRAITLILGSDNRVFYYTGTGQDPEHTKIEVGYFNDGKKSIRQALINRKAEVASNPNLNAKERADGIVVLIKPDEKSTYKNVVDILDEMKICDIHIYAIVDISKPEKEMIQSVAVE